MMDTILNEVMRPVFVDDPSEVKRRLKAGHPEGWTKVLIGETGTVVSVTEYLYEEKYKEVLAMIDDILRKSELAMYKRSPERLRVYKESAARKIIERVLED